MGPHPTSCHGKKQEFTRREYLVSRASGGRVRAPLAIDAP